MGDTESSCSRSKKEREVAEEAETQIVRYVEVWSLFPIDVAPKTIDRLEALICQPDREFQAILQKSCREESGGFVLLVCKMFNGRSTTERLKFKLLLFNLVTNDKYFAWCFWISH